MYLFFSKPTRELAAVADESLNRLAGVPLKIGVQMRMGGGEWADPTRYQGVQTPHRVFMLLWALGGIRFSRPAKVPLSLCAHDASCDRD